MRKLPSKEDKLKVYKKWMPIIENHLKFENESVNNIICIYCEWFTSDDPGSELPNKLMDIKDKIESYKRIEILGKFLNPASGIVEYKLENGKFVPISQINYELSNDELIEIFGIEFIRELDPQEFRDSQLNKIL